MCCVLLFSAFAGSTATGQTADPLLKIKMFSGLGKDLPYAFSQRMSVPVVGGTPTVKIASGTILKFNAGPILLPEGVEPASWREEYGSDFDQPFSPFATDPDPDLPGLNAPTKLNFGLFDPNVSGCGDSLENPCTFDGSDPDPVAGVMNGGDTARRFFVKITAEAGATLWATHQLYSAPLADLKIDVVGSENAATTQEEIDEAFAEQKAADAQEARDLVETLETPTFETVDGKRVYDAYPGYDTETTSLMKFFPSELRIRKGDSVSWNFDVLNGEVHTASFPKGKALEVSANGFVPACDPDGDDGDLPDRQANFEDGPPCKEGHELEVDLNKKLTAQQGDGTFPGGPKMLENSGLRGGVLPSGNGVAGNGGDWNLVFNKSSGDKAFKYICMFHPFMKGKIVVK